MVLRDHFINLIRSKGYEYKRETDKVCLYRKRGTSEVITIRRKQDPLDDSYVRTTLQQMGLSADEIEKFIAQNKHC